MTTQKGKSVTTPPKEAKKKATWKFTEKPTVASKEGTSVNPGAILGPRASMLGSPSVAEKILGGVIPLVVK